MFRFDSTERANREPAARVSLKVFDVGSGSEAQFLERLHWAVAIFATHEFIAFCERFLEGAWEPTSTHLNLTLRHRRRFLLSSTLVYLDASQRVVGIHFSHQSRSECPLERARDTVGKRMMSRHVGGYRVTSDVGVYRHKGFHKFSTRVCSHWPSPLGPRRV